MNQRSTTFVANVPVDFAELRELIPRISTVMQVFGVIAIVMGVVTCCMLAVGGIATMIEVGASVSRSVLTDIGRLSLADWMHALAGVQ